MKYRNYYLETKKWNAITLAGQASALFSTILFMIALLGNSIHIIFRVGLFGAAVVLMVVGLLASWAGNWKMAEFKFNREEEGQRIYHHKGAFY